MILYLIEVNSMISAFSIIFEDKILYCSKKKKYRAFEVLLFVDKLLKSINPKKDLLEKSENNERKSDY